jgi:hypothetical protein
MIRLPKNKKIITDIPFINEGYTVLHYDQEPILFSGYNRYGNRIIASSVETDVKKKTDFFFHVLVDDKTYADFFLRKITYKNILKAVGSFFLIKSDFGNPNLDIYIVSISDIPEKYIPLDDSYCPEFEIPPSSDYEMKLNGGDAERHLSTPDAINTLTENFKKIISESTAALSPIKDYTAAVYVRPFQKSSFKIVFNVQMLANKPNINPHLFDFDTLESYKEFISNYIEYSINSLDKEIVDLTNNKTYGPGFKKVLDKARDVFSKSGKENPGTGFENTIIKELEKSTVRLKEISDTLGKNFNSVQLTNVSSDGLENILGTIDDKFKENINSALQLVESNTSKYLKDSSPRDYKILVYHLNEDSRSGNATIIQSDNENASKPRFKVKGDKPLGRSIFTESMHFTRVITVSAVGTIDKENKKIKNLEIEF